MRGRSAFLAGAGAVPDGSYDGVRAARANRSGTDARVRRGTTSLLGQAASRARRDRRGRRPRAVARRQSRLPAGRRRRAGRTGCSTRTPRSPASAACSRRAAGCSARVGALLDQPALSGVTISASAATGGLRVRVHRRSTRGSAAGERARRAVLADARGCAAVEVDAAARRARSVPVGAAHPRRACERAGSRGAIGAAAVPARRQRSRPRASTSRRSSRSSPVRPRSRSRRVGRAVAAHAGARDRRPHAAPGRRPAGCSPGSRRRSRSCSRRRAAGAGQAPELGDVQVGRRHRPPARRSRPGLQLDYAVFRGLVVVSTSVRAIAGVARQPRSLADDAGYHATLSGRPRSGDLATLSRLQPAPQPRRADGTDARRAAVGAAAGPRADPGGRSHLDEGGVRHDRGAVPPDPMTMLSDNEFLFTSESVTEGHPGQDRRPDLRRRARRRAARRPDRAGRVRDARQHRARRRLRGDHDRDVRRHPGRRARDDQADRLHRRRVRLRLPHVRRDQRDRQAVAGHRPGRRPGVGGAHRPGRRRRARPRRRRRPGDDVRLRDATRPTS